MPSRKILALLAVAGVVAAIVLWQTPLGDDARALLQRKRRLSPTFRPA